MKENKITKQVTSFIAGMNKLQKIRLQQIIANDSLYLVNTAKTYNLDYDLFMQELKNQLNVKGLDNE